jgi:hypothetical protein
MRLVLDTNALVSAFFWQGVPGRLIELAIKQADDDHVLAWAIAAPVDLIVLGRQPSAEPQNPPKHRHRHARRRTA